MENQANREDLELKKLSLEIKEMETNWWQKPHYLGIFIPAMLTITTLLVGILTDYFDFKNKQIGFSEKKEQLDSELRAAQDSLSKTTAQYELYKDVNKRMKQARYLRDLTVMEYSKMQHTRDIEETLNFLKAKFEDILPMLLSNEEKDLVYLDTNPTWTAIERIYGEWEPNQTILTERRQTLQLEEIFYDLRKEILVTLGLN